jgi:methyl-accepting chemotaxis protein
MQILKKMNSSLSAKILLPVSLLTIGVFAVLLLANGREMKHETMYLIESSAEKVSGLMSSAIEKPMAIGDDKGTREQFASFADEYPEIELYMTDYAGEITYSSHTNLLRSQIDTVTDNPEFLALTQQSLEKEFTGKASTEFGGKDRFVRVETIMNEKDCWHCHGSSRKILGSIILVKDISYEVATLNNGLINSALISICGAIALLIMIPWLLKRIVLGKIVDISQTSDLIRQGDYDAELTVAGEDELANLSKNLQATVEVVKNQLVYNKSVLSGIVVPMYVTDAEEKVTFINEPLLNIMGKSPREAEGRTISQLFYDNTQKSVTDKVIQSAVPQKGKLRYKNSRMDEFSLKYEISPLMDTDGNVVGAIGVMMDQTQEEKDKAHIMDQQENLLFVAEKVTNNASVMAGSAEEMRTQMNELTRAMSQQNDQVAQVATAMEEMNATVLEVARNAGEAADSSVTADEIARKGGIEVRATADETRVAAQRAENLAGSLNELTDNAENIGRIISVINDIADQTNLLALNAAIEAARAGDAGRGFAVVADEVRKLAEKTMGATNEVEGAVKLIQESTKNAVQEMHENKEGIEKTAATAEEAGRILEEIVEQAKTISDQVRNIATAAEEQSSTSEEINTNITDINELTKMVTSQVQSANVSIQSVAGTADELKTLVESFKSSDATKRYMVAEECL